MLYDRNPLWIAISDKLLVRDYVSKRVGSAYLVPLLWSGVNPQEIPFDQLPQKFVIKANHGCGYNIIVQNKTKLDQKKTKMQLKQWLGVNYCRDIFLGVEWSYKNIKPVIIIESFIDDNGQLPADYKFLCYKEHVEFIQVDRARFTEEHTRTFFDRHFSPLPFTYGKKLYEGKVTIPNNYEEMLCVAETLAQGFNFIRVDLYSVNNKIYCGELTCNPGGGIIRFNPKKYDFLLGEKWE